MAIVLDHLEENERSRVGEDVRNRVEPFAGEAGIELPGMSLVLSAS